ncbi:hypothetical protein LSM04_001767 [Trypanosoma melophagium]|uniref:uncharacterized protein n=1 Tax=Trypanosoma melophagium TaxID=715481 RepID=UPI00351A57C4|nr:hypothetical protein LSM04_001767 [Trypanosoma melophagium]
MDAAACRRLQHRMESRGRLANNCSSGHPCNCIHPPPRVNTINTSNSNNNRNSNNRNNNNNNGSTTVLSPSAQSWLLQRVQGVEVDITGGGIEHRRPLLCCCSCCMGYHHMFHTTTIEEEGKRGSTTSTTAVETPMVPKATATETEPKETPTNTNTGSNSHNNNRTGAQQTALSEEKPNEQTTPSVAFHPAKASTLLSSFLRLADSASPSHRTCMRGDAVSSAGVQCTGIENRESQQQEQQTQTQSEPQQQQQQRERQVSSSLLLIPHDREQGIVRGETDTREKTVGASAQTSTEGITAVTQTSPVWVTPPGVNFTCISPFPTAVCVPVPLANIQKSQQQHQSVVPVQQPQQQPAQPVGNSLSVSAVPLAATGAAGIGTTTIHDGSQQSVVPIQQPAQPVGNSLSVSAVPPAATGAAGIGTTTIHDGSQQSAVPIQQPAQPVGNSLSVSAVPPAATGAAGIGTTTIHDGSQQSVVPIQQPAQPVGNSLSVSAVPPAATGAAGIGTTTIHDGSQQSVVPIQQPAQPVGNSLSVSAVPPAATGAAGIGTTTIHDGSQQSAVPIQQPAQPVGNSLSVSAVPPAATGAAGIGTTTIHDGSQQSAVPIQQPAQPVGNSLSVSAVPPAATGAAGIGTTTIHDGSQQSAVPIQQPAQPVGNSLSVSAVPLAATGAAGIGTTTIHDGSQQSAVPIQQPAQPVGNSLSVSAVPPAATGAAGMGTASTQQPGAAAAAAAYSSGGTAVSSAEPTPADVINALREKLLLEKADAYVRNLEHQKEEEERLSREREDRLLLYKQGEMAALLTRLRQDDHEVLEAMYETITQRVEVGGPYVSTPVVHQREQKQQEQQQQGNYSRPSTTIHTTVSQPLPSSPNVSLFPPGVMAAYNTSVSNVAPPQKEQEEQQTQSIYSIPPSLQAPSAVTSLSQPQNETATQRVQEQQPQPLPPPPVINRPTPLPPPFTTAPPVSSQVISEEQRTLHPQQEQKRDVSVSVNTVDSPWDAADGTMKAWVDRHFGSTLDPQHRALLHHVLLSREAEMRRVLAAESQCKQLETQLNALRKPDLSTTATDGKNSISTGQRQHEQESELARALTLLYAKEEELKAVRKLQREQEAKLEEVTRSWRPQTVHTSGDSISRDKQLREEEERRWRLRYQSIEQQHRFSVQRLEELQAYIEQLRRSAQQAVMNVASSTANFQPRSADTTTVWMSSVSGSAPTCCMEEKTPYSSVSPGPPPSGMQNFTSLSNQRTGGVLTSAPQQQNVTLGIPNHIQTPMTSGVNNSSLPNANSGGVDRATVLQQLRSELEVECGRFADETERWHKYVENQNERFSKLRKQ